MGEPKRVSSIFQRLPSASSLFFGQPLSENESESSDFQVSLGTSMRLSDAAVSSPSQILLIFEVSSSDNLVRMIGSVEEILKENFELNSIQICGGDMPR